MLFGGTAWAFASDSMQARLDLLPHTRTMAIPTTTYYGYTYYHLLWLYVLPLTMAMSATTCYATPGDQVSWLSPLTITRRAWTYSSSRRLGSCHSHTSSARLYLLWPYLLWLYSLWPYSLRTYSLLIVALLTVYAHSA